MGHRTLCLVLCLSLCTSEHTYCVVKVSIINKVALDESGWRTPEPQQAGLDDLCSQSRTSMVVRAQNGETLSHFERFEGSSAY
uniref:Putative secreted protein n=1 Tax=Anopheles darlingi TaxID=43151 RepID=A0A2M4DKK2_ANODA